MTKVVTVLCILAFFAMLVVKAATPKVSLFEMCLPLIILLGYVAVKEVLRYFVTK